MIAGVADRAKGQARTWCRGSCPAYWTITAPRLLLAPSRMPHSSRSPPGQQLRRRSKRSPGVPVSQCARCTGTSRLRTTSLRHCRVEASRSSAPGSESVRRRRRRWRRSRMRSATEVRVPTGPRSNAGSPPWRAVRHRRVANVAYATAAEVLAEAIADRIGARPDRGVAADCRRLRGGVLCTRRPGGG